MKIYFDHEKLEAYKKALAFASWAEPILERLPKFAGVYSQLDRARTSIVLNIPEGNGRFTRLTNAFSKKIENHEAAIALHYMYHNFAAFIALCA